MMRQIFISGIIALFVGCNFALSNLHAKDVSEVEPFIFEDFINQTIQNIRQNISDPLLIDSLEITPNLDFLTGTFRISNFELAGLSGFQVPALHFALIGFTFNFTFVFPSITLTTDHFADLILGDGIPIQGEGTINVDIDTIEIKGSTQVDLTDGIQVKNLLIQLYVNNITFDLHGLLNDEILSSLLSQLLNNIVTRFIDENQALLTEIISPIAEDIINGILKNAGQTTTVSPTEALPLIPHQ